MSDESESLTFYQNMFDNLVCLTQWLFFLFENKGMQKSRETNVKSGQWFIPFWIFWKLIFTLLKGISSRRVYCVCCYSNVVAILYGRVYWFWVSSQGMEFWICQGAISTAYLDKKICLDAMQSCHLPSTYDNLLRNAYLNTTKQYKFKTLILPAFLSCPLFF